MGKIKQMDKHLSELIAAGEVVERPFSVIKELAENAIDAGASAVTVEIRNGGVTLMRVTDNGSGIAREDVRLAFRRHATSKLLSEDGLSAIGTLGFRGEALASVASVARVELLTRTAEEPVGTRYVIEGGEEVELEDAGCPKGTTLYVRDLFYNTPARMKFLKKDVSEGNSVAGVLDRMALSHPEVSFKLIRDGRQALLTPGDGKLLSAVYAVYGRDFAKGLIPVDYSLNGLKISGFVSAPSHARANRAMQLFFINGRYVKSRTAAAALEEACRGSVMVGKFPACVLDIAVALEAVDVNVHPAKIEVRFVNERPVFDVVYYGCRSALEAKEQPKELKIPASRLIPAQPETVQLPLSAQQTAKPAPREKASVPQAPKPPLFSVPQRPFSGVSSLKSSVGVLYETGAQETAAPSAQEPPAEHNAPVCRDVPAREKQPAREEQPAVLEAAAPKPAEPFRLIGEAFDTYMILEEGDRILLIDKHAAHERLLYEKLKSQGCGECSQLLLSPVAVTLDKDGYDALLQHLDELREAGFEAEDFGGGSVLLRAAPLWLSGEDAAEVVTELAGKLISGSLDPIPERLEWLYHSIACRAAVKAGNRSSAQELVQLARQTLAENVKHCPHGRPVAIALTRYNLEKQFGRV